MRAHTCIHTCLLTYLPNSTAEGDADKDKTDFYTAYLIATYIQSDCSVHDGRSHHTTFFFVGPFGGEASP